MQSLPSLLVPSPNNVVQKCTPSDVAQRLLPPRLHISCPLNVSFRPSLIQVHLIIDYNPKPIAP